MQIDSEKIEQLKKMRLKTILFSIFFVLLLGTALFTIKISIIKPAEQTSAVFDYSITDTINYKVHLFENSFYEEPYLGMDRQYATDLIKSIEVEFLSNAKTSKAAILDINYEITAEINGNYSSDTSNKKTELWNKSFILLPKKEETAETKTGHTIKEKIDLDFGYYNQIVVDFKKELRLNIDAIFEVQMLINYQIKVADEVINKSEILILSFPLNRSAFNIIANVQEPVKETVYNVGTLIINYHTLIPAVIFLIVALVLFINFVQKILKLNKKTEYQNKLNKILRNYGEIIAQSEQAPNFAKYDILDIANFEDLVNIENEVRIPIIYYEKEFDKEGWFTLVHGEQMYRFILYDNEKEQKNYEHTMQLKLK